MLTPTSCLFSHTKHTQFPATDSAHCICSIYCFISSTITASLIQRVQTESSKSVKHKKPDEQYY